MVQKGKAPYSREAEKSVLGAILMNEENLVTAMQILHADDFFDKANATIYQAMVDLHEDAKPIDPVTLVALLENRGVLEEVGGAETLAEQIYQVPLERNCEHYCEIVKSKSVLRAMISMAQKIVEDCYTRPEELEEIMEEAEKSIFSISQGKYNRDFKSIQDVLGETLQKIEEISKNKGKLTGLSTGFAELDMYTTGLQPSDLIFIAARPSMGKTALALNIATNTALAEGSKVAIFSLEMSEIQLVQRILCSVGLIDSNKLRTGELEEKDWTDLANAYTRLFKTTIEIDDTPGISVSEIRSKCRRMKMEKGLDLIVIDYLQLMASKNFTENRQQEVSEMSRGLKILAREMQCPVVCLSQLSRMPEARKDHHPMLSDLRESGSIEQDADVVMFLYREHYYDKENGNPFVAELEIAKQRNGPTTRFKLGWMPEHTRFNDLIIDEY